MKHLYFVRHGQSEHNAQDIWSGQIETPLTEKGRRQAATAAQAAKELHIDYILSSPYARALHTAQAIANGIGYPLESIEVSDLLVERHFGNMEGKTNEAGMHPDDFEGVESHESIIARAQAALDYIKTLPADTILVVSHGSFGRAVRHLLHPDMPYRPGDPATRFPNAEIIKLL